MPYLGWVFHSAACWEIIEDGYFRNTWRAFEDGCCSNKLENVPHCLWAILWFLGNDSFYQVIEVWRDVFVGDQCRWRCCGQVFAEQFVGRAAGVRRFACAQFDNHATYRVNVAALIQRLATNLFRGHVRPGSFDFVLTAK